MKKIIVIGCPGSGKSTLSRKLHNITKIPLYHLDMMFWNSDKTTVSKDIFLQRLSEVLTKDSWIIDGNYSSTMEIRVNECDTVIFLDLPPDVCLDGVRQRKGKQRSDIPWVENEDDEEFIEFIKTFNKEQRPKIITLINKYNEKNIFIFKSREEADVFLNKCEGESEDR